MTDLAWVEAFWDARRGNKRRLIELLESQQPLPDDLARKFLLEWARGKFNKPKGKSGRPPLGAAEKVAQSKPLVRAARRYAELMDQYRQQGRIRGMKEQAIHQAAQEENVEPRRLRNFLSNIGKPKTHN
jgi:hypothetical protein